MIKLNRIGNKLGLASAVGVLLAIGMVGNQMMAGTRVDEASDSANRSQRVADGTLTAHVFMRQMQLAGRAIRLAKSTAQVDKDLVEVHQFAAAEAKELDSALASARRPETRSRLEKIKSLTESYSAGVDELANAQTDLLKSMEKRTTISTEWEKAFEHLLASPVLAEQADRKDAEILLYQADGKIKGMRAAVWRLSTTGEESQKKTIATYKTALDDNLARIRGLSDNKGFRDGVDALASIATRFAAANDETVKAEELKTEILAKRTVSVVNESGEQMASAVAYAQNNAKVSKEEVAATTARANTVNLAMAVVVVLTLVASGVFSFLGIARPMTRLNGALDKMAAGNLEIVVPGADRGDEIGDLAKTVTVIRENAEQKARDESEAKARQDQVAAQQRRTDMIRMADNFEGAVGEIIETVSSASTELEASAGALTSTAERAQELATSVAAASGEASTNVQSVASATEEMASSVNEISRQVQDSARMANEAVGQARTTNDRVGELSKAAARIGDVVELINTIAGQTNLLALNATIEAARAGEAGRGFAVVASEVKALAEQTAKATGEIGQQISGIQAATQESVNAIQEISGTIEKLSEISSTIAAAVEEQGAATQEISRNVQQAAHGTQRVSSNIADVQRGASETGSASSQVLSAAKSLSGDSNRLKLEVDKFLNSVRVA
jgi:methyl-accepting chemotaxis protein